MTVLVFAFVLCPNLFKHCLLTQTQCLSTSRSHLFGNLSKVVDEPDGGVFLQGVLNAVDVNIALIEQVVEDVVGIHG